MNSRQAELEQEMRDRGTERFWKAIFGARKDGHESDTVYGLSILKKHIDPVAAGIEGFLEEASSSGKAGRRHIAVRYLSLIDSQVAAFISVRSILDSITMRRHLQKAALVIASAIEDEVRFSVFSKENKALWGKLNRDLDSRVRNRQHKRTVLIHSMNKAARKDGALVWENWPIKDKYHLGMKCIDILIQTTGIVKIATVTEGRRDTVAYVEATEETLAWIDGKTSFYEFLSPVHMPTVIPPKPWTTPFDGGYHTTMAPLRLVKTRNAHYLEELAGRVDEMPKLYRAVNAIQETPWKVNGLVLSVMKKAWEQSLVIGDLPQREDHPEPAKPADIATNEEALTAWKRKASKVHVANRELRSKRLQAIKLMFVAEKFEKDEAIYFPHQLDFRGRLYAVPSFLNPQGCDAAKSLLVFAESKPVGKAGLRWIKIHTANNYGEDKCSFDQRVKWVDDNIDLIRRIATDPMANLEWTEADKPWQFLAAAIELSCALNHPIPEQFHSSLPVSVDGACNGLQNFSAMLRDEVGGAAVNLLPTEKPADIYQAVADVVKVKVEADAKGTDEEKAEMAKQWLAFGFDRKATKRCVMVLPYGGTLYSSREFVQEYLKERVQNGSVLPWEESFKPAVYLSGHIWKSIGEVVIAAKAAMDWLQTASRLAAKDGLPVAWTTPVGFPVLQAYPETQSKRVATKIGNSVVLLTLAEETQKVDKRRQANGISPNFVHSMDASCLIMSVDRALDKGITNFAMVHDSYGTLAADMDMLSVELREAFTDLYQHDVLEEFRTSILGGLRPEHAAELPATPSKGSLELSAVKQSLYFFA